MGKNKNKVNLVRDIMEYLKILEDEGVVVEKADIADLSEEWTKIWASNVNIARITPHLVDGLKPSARRALLGLHENKYHGEKFMKVARAMADTLQFHPHGETSIAAVIYKNGQPWKNNVCMIDRQGNYGNIKGMPPADPRYPECKLSAAANYILFSDYKDSNVPMRPTYDGEAMEPDYLPARIPLVLCNSGFSSIGVGLASNIPPFNMGEVIDATIKLIKDPKANIMLVPDSPTGCDIIDNGQFGIINNVGQGHKLTVMMQATYEIDYIKNIITITSIPLQQSTDNIIARIIDLRSSGKKYVQDLLDISDDTGETDVSLKLTLSPKANPDEFIQTLFEKKTGLRMSFPVEIRVVDNFRQHVWGIKELLLKWIESRQECIRATYNKKYMDATNIHHMNEVLLMVSNDENSKKALKISRAAANKAEVQQEFMKAFGVTSVQAKTLAEMSMYQFNKDAHEKYQKVKVDIEAKIKEYANVILDDKAVDEVMIGQLMEAKKLFATPRKSAIIKADKPVEKIPNTMCLVGVSKDGYVKKLDASQYASVGFVGKTSQVIATLINNRDNLLIFGDDGRMSRIGVSSIPEMTPEDNGIELARYFTLTGSPVSLLNEKAVQEGAGDIFIITKDGYGKRVKMSEFAQIKDFKDCVSLNENDKLVAAMETGDEDFIIYTNFGDGLRLNTSSIRYQSRGAKGVSMIKLRAGEEVVGINFLDKGCDKVVYITSSGKMKLTEEKLLPLMDRKNEPIALIGLEPSEYLIGVGFVSMKDSVMVYRRKSEPVEIPVSSLKVTTRIAKPEKIVKTPSGDSVIAFKIIRH